ncbi:hypothetical protein KP509_33G054500 [Ceratopteris richardii]|uniref:PTM/DIR17-like Tudor domain-containing protein n=1 Tax=Ceratopteris richardii TaxID=49495 RepID=A0A8T2QP78_CERRI|nr:hypothetical protein KP509_33G054500 [Ceratopteris richardii]KAH7285992.1 hypothetical protein KP509_33G054500 [Ceratopteris richardii]
MRKQSDTSKIRTTQTSVARDLATVSGGQNSSTAEQNAATSGVAKEKVSEAAEELSSTSGSRLKSEDKNFIAEAEGTGDYTETKASAVEKLLTGLEKAASSLEGSKSQEEKSATPVQVCIEVTNDGLPVQACVEGGKEHNLSVQVSTAEHEKQVSSIDSTAEKIGKQDSLVEKFEGERVKQGVCLSSEVKRGEQAPPCEVSGDEKEKQTEVKSSTPEAVKQTPPPEVSIGDIDMPVTAYIHGVDKQIQSLEAAASIEDAGKQGHTLERIAEPTKGLIEEALIHEKFKENLPNVPSSNVLEAGKADDSQPRNPGGSIAANSADGELQNVLLSNIQETQNFGSPEARKTDGPKTEDISQVTQSDLFKEGKQDVSQCEKSVECEVQLHISEMKKSKGQQDGSQPGKSEECEELQLEISEIKKSDMSRAMKLNGAEPKEPTAEDIGGENAGHSHSKTSILDVPSHSADMPSTYEDGRLENGRDDGPRHSADMPSTYEDGRQENGRDRECQIELETCKKASDSNLGNSQFEPGGVRDIDSHMDIDISSIKDGDKAEDAECNTGAEPLLLQAEEHVPDLTEPSIAIGDPAATQATLEAGVVEEIVTAECALELTMAPSKGTSEGEAGTSSRMDGNHVVKVDDFSGASVDKIVEKATYPYTGFFGNIYDNALVSSVEGETVLIVENLSHSSQVIPNLEKAFPNASGDASRLGTQHKELKSRGITEGQHAGGKNLVGRKVRKKFGRKVLNGEVIEYEPELNLYKVAYEDGKNEKLDVYEIQDIVPLGEENEQVVKRQHRQINVSSTVKRNVGKGRTMSSAVSDVAFKEEIPVQQKVQSRSVRKRHVIDTSNDANADSLDSDGSYSDLDDSSADDEDDDGDVDDDDDDDDDEDEPGSRTRTLKRRQRGKFNARKRRKTSHTTEGKVLKSPPLRHSARLREENPVKNQENSAEKHRISTRRSTGLSNSHTISSDDLSLSSQRKMQVDSQQKPSSGVELSAGSGENLIGRKIKKDFGGQFYYGEIVHYDNGVKYYKVLYEDGDEEELEWPELAPTLLPQEGDRTSNASEVSQVATGKSPETHPRDYPKKDSTMKGKEGTVISTDNATDNGDIISTTRKLRRKIRTASVSVMMKGLDNAATSTPMVFDPSPRALAAVRFASASDADVFEYYGWGEVVNFDKSKCPELRATRLLPTSSPVVHLAASRHHLVALTAAGQVWVWRCKHGYIHTRCNEWEHVALLDSRKIVLVDISGPDVDRASAGYQPNQEDQVPDPFYLAAVCSNGEDIILQGSQAHEAVHTYQNAGEPQYPGLRETFLQSNSSLVKNMGRIIQLSVGMVEAADESPFIGYITDSDCVFIRSATKDFMEEINLITGYTGKPIKIQCGRVYHAILLTDDGRAWTWGQGYYLSTNVHSAGFTSKLASPFCVCQPALGTLVGRKVIDVGCYGEDFIALTNDGDVHQWTHAPPNPAAGVYNVPATPVYGQGPKIGNGDKLKQVAIGAGICAGISEAGKVHTWRSYLKGGFAGIVGSEQEALTPLGREEGMETTVLALAARCSVKVACVAGSLLIVVKRKHRGRRGGKRKLNVAGKGKSPDNEAVEDAVE